MGKKPKKTLQIDVDHLSDEELEEVAGGKMGTLPRMAGIVGCACVCHGDDADATSASTTTSVYNSKNK